MWKCKNCKEDNENSFDICWSCGADKKGSLNKDFDTNEAVQNSSYTEEYDNKFQDYDVAWTFANLCSVVGWIALIAGILFAFIGISQINNVVYGNSFLVKLTAMLPGLGIATSGLVMIVIGQISRATIDAATNSKEILEIMEAKSK